MDLQELITRWLAEHHPDVKIDDRAIVCLDINSQYIPAKYEGDVWYVCRIEEDRIYLLKPASESYGQYLLAGIPTFFEQLDAIIKFYRTYAP